jgi:UDP-N-acetyl-D-mannosaminuronic acid dehydrogenase
MSKFRSVDSSPDHGEKRNREEIMSFEYDVCVVGGCGHVGLPLAITFAKNGLKVCVHDIDDRSVALVRAGKMPYREQGAPEALLEVIGHTLFVANDRSLIPKARYVIIVIGTPVDEHLNPTFHSMRRVFVQQMLPLLVDGQCVILRSTVYPGTTSKLADLVAKSGRDVRVAFCPERVAEGKAMHELIEFPQMVSGCDPKAEEMAAELFSRIAKSVIRLSPLEAEFTKIFANVWRYIQFATANQFFMVATDHGLDFFRIYDALTRDYPRMAGLPKSGFAAGPCLFKDTMQLAAATVNGFAMGHAAMLINEGLPNFVVRHLKARFALDQMNVGILGMAFKADSDDSRESLSYKLRKVLEYEAATILCTDIAIEDPSFLPLDEVIDRSDILIVGSPHREYRKLVFPPSKWVVDVWNFFEKGSLFSGSGEVWVAGDVPAPAPFHK